MSDGWISVNDERKPPLRGGEDSISEDVLLYVPEWKSRDGRNPIVVGHYLHKSKMFRPSGSLGWEKAVTHWHAYPPPPRGA